MTPELQAIICDRIIDDGHADRSWALVVLAALEGDQVLTSYLGLTLVIGRNGSGKSSFAEALECLFTGTSYRWEGRPVQWKAGWKNLLETGSVH